MTVLPLSDLIHIVTYHPESNAGAGPRADVHFSMEFDSYMYESKKGLFTDN